jgi:succinoglycan biosynthesis transport protein ExoP
MKQLSPYIIERTLDTPMMPYRPAAARFAADPETTGIGLAECWKVIRTHGRLIVGLMGVALVLTAVVVFSMTPRYVATARLLIEPEPPRLMDASSLLQSMQNADSANDDYAKTQYSLLRDEQLVAQVIHELNLESNPHFAQPPGVIRRLLGWLTQGASQKTARDRLGVSTASIDHYLAHLDISPENGTRLVKVRFDSPDPELAARIVNTHVADFLTLSQQIRADAGNAARAFLGKELVRIKAQVEKSELALNDYRDRTGILSFGEKDQESNEVAQKRMEALDEALTGAQNDRIKAQAEMELVKSGAYDSLPDVVNNLMIENLRPDIDRLQAEYAEMAAKYNDAYPPLREVKAKLDEAQARLSKEMAAIARATERKAAAAIVSEQNLEGKVDEERRRDFARNDASLQDAVLAREVDANREIYEAVLKRMNEIGVNGSAPVSNIELVEEAVPPPLPSLPQKAKALLIAGVGSGLLGIGLAFLIEQFDDRLKSAEEIQAYLHLPELAVVPDFTKLNGRALQALPDGALGLLCQSGEPDVPAPVGHRQHALDTLEAYKPLRNALLYSRAGGAPKTMLFVSAVPLEGKTLTASGTALAFAQTGARTLLIDADLRRPRCHRIFKTSDSAGLSELLVGRVEPWQAIQRLDNWEEHDYQGLFFLGAGRRVPNPGELLTSMRMFETIQRLSADFDFILIDAAPCASASDTVGLATMVEGVVVVAAVDTPKQTIRTVCKRLGDSGAKVLGVVLNRVNPRDNAFIDLSHRYGYGNYGSPADERKYLDAAAAG